VASCGRCGLLANWRTVWPEPDSLFHCYSDPVKECCERHCFARGATARPVFDAFDDSHGRLVRRRVFVCPQAASLEALRAWPGLRTVLAVETIRGVNGSGKVEAEIRYFLSSCGDVWRDNLDEERGEQDKNV
jgi:hypothetical protein